MDRGVPAVVIDNGSGFSKAGFAGDDAPRAVFPTIVGRARHQTISLHSPEDAVRVGYEAQNRRGILTLRYPVYGGLITRWEEMEKLWDHTFYRELRVAPEEHPTFLVEPINNTPAHRERTAQIMFESLGTPSLYAAKQPVLSLRTSDRTTGVVVDSGHVGTRIIPIQDGVPIWDAISELNIAGADFTSCLVLDSMSKGYPWFTRSNMELPREIKEKHCYVALDYEQELEIAITSSALKQQYRLPGGETFYINEERFRIPEALFKPYQVGSEAPGLDKLIYQSISQCNPAIQPNLYANIVLAGGTTMFPGFGERLQRELAVLAPAVMQVTVIADPRRKYSAWVGGSMLASDHMFQQMFISKQEYDEVGPRIVHLKC